MQTERCITRYFSLTYLVSSVLLKVFLSVLFHRVHPPTPFTRGLRLLRNFQKVSLTGSEIFDMTKKGSYIFSVITKNLNWKILILLLKVQEKNNI